MPLLVALAMALGAIVVTVLIGILGDPLPSASADSTISTPAPAQTADAASHGAGEGTSRPGPPPVDGTADRSGTVGAADGGVADGTTVFDDHVPAVANLDTELLDALRRAATDATGDGITFRVNSGWRSAAFQDLLLQEAVAEYGSPEEAARWVATPTTSLHVRGEAIDMGQDASAWLSANGAAYGLCQVYENEPWHYELRPGAVDRGCPAMYTDPTEDPRMKVG